MTDSRFRVLVLTLAAVFAVFFTAVVLPALFDDPDVFSAYAAGFANPFAAGYSADVVVTWLILVAWVLRERRAHGVRGGWIAIVLGVVPGVAVGFAAYLLIRSRPTGVPAGVTT